MSSTRAEKAFSRISNAVGMSEAGKAWITAAVDPFHDEPIEGIRGIPDGLNSNSLVQIVKSSLSVKCPASVTTGTWDCHIQSLPITRPTLQISGFRPWDKTISANTGNGIYSVFLPGSGQAPQKVGPITINAGATGTNNGIFGGVSVYNDVISPAYNFTSGTYRVIAKGYEVISSGPALYKSGTVFTYGLPVSNTSMTETVNCYGIDQAATVRVNSKSTFDFPDTPLNTAEVMLVPNAQSWAAKDGVYAIDRLNDPHVDTFSLNGILPSQTSITPGPDSTGTAAAFGSVVAFMLTDAACNTINYSAIDGKYTAVPLSYNGTDVQKMNLSGAYFTGLNLQDVLTINVIWYVERMPDDSQRDLLVLAKPTPHYDPIALDMYSVIMAEMPWAMIQKSNGFGDWFKDAVSVVTDTIAPAIGALPGPIGMLGKGATIGGKILGGLMGGNKKEEVKEQSPAFYENSPSKIERRDDRHLKSEKKKITKLKEALRKTSAPQKKKKKKKMK